MNSIQFRDGLRCSGGRQPNVGDAKASVQSLTKAYELRARASKPEKLYITGHYYNLVTGDLDRTVDLSSGGLDLSARCRPLDNLSLGFASATTEKAWPQPWRCGSSPGFLRLSNRIESYMALNRIDPNPWRRPP